MPHPHDSPSLVFEPCYLLDSVLVTPKDHPLARRRRVHPNDLRLYPFVNAPTAIGDPAVTGKLEDLGVFRTEPRRIEAYFAAAIRRYVATRLRDWISWATSDPAAGQGSSRAGDDPRIRVDPHFLVRRKTALIPHGAGPFIDTVKSVMGRKATGGK